LPYVLRPLDPPPIDLRSRAEGTYAADLHVVAALVLAGDEPLDRDPVRERLLELARDVPAAAGDPLQNDRPRARPVIDDRRRDLDHAGAATAEGGKMQGRLGKVERDDRMWDPTSTSRLGVTVTPRRPGFDFEGLEHEVPRAWHPDGIGPTAFLEALSAMAPVAEDFFIDDARRLLPRVADGATRAEGDAFLRQEAAHA